jgi:hypothetical protein
MPLFDRAFQGGDADQAGAQSRTPRRRRRRVGA